MKLATIRQPDGLQAVRIDDDAAVLLDAPDVDTVLRTPDWRSRAASASGRRLALDELDYAPLVTRPGKIVCVGLNYRSHIEESNIAVPQFPILFAKFASSLAGAYDDLELPPVSDMIDWEAELAVVIGTTAYRADMVTAEQAIAGYTVLNDVTARDWQTRTSQFLQGKAFERLTPVGPYLVTADAFTPRDHEISTEVSGTTYQQGNTSDLLFDSVTLVSYISSFTRLEPGDLIATGTPGGVGQAQDPPRFLKDGDEMVTSIEGLGQLRNAWRAPALVGSGG